jgi:hypothetical protein
MSRSVGYGQIWIQQAPMSIWHTVSEYAMLHSNRTDDIRIAPARAFESGSRYRTCDAHVFETLLHASYSLILSHFSNTSLGLYLC